MRYLEVVSTWLLGTAPALGGVMIAVSSGHGLYEIDAATGAKTRIGTVSSNVHTPAGLAYDRATDTAYICSTGLDDAVYTLDVGTGVATLVGAFGSSSFLMHGMEFDDSTGTLYGGSSGTLYRIDRNNGHATPVGSQSGVGNLRLGYQPYSDTLYGIYGNVLQVVDRQTGVRTPIGPLAGPTNTSAMAFSRDDGQMYVLDNLSDALYTVNLTTGAASLVGSTGGGENLLGLAYIPSPGTLLALGLGAVAANRRTR